MKRYLPKVRLLGRPFAKGGKEGFVKPPQKGGFFEGLWPSTRLQMHLEP